MASGELQVFISSKMRRNALKAERAAAVAAVDEHPCLQAWHWETCGYAAPYPPMDICLQAVKDSHMLVLLLGSDLTDHTREEHKLAVRLRIPDLIFIREGRRKNKAWEYVDRHQNRATYMIFRSTSELKTLITKSLTEEITRGYLRGRGPQVGTQVQYSTRSSRRGHG